jgi:type II secretory pathway pseudopilin PulG
MNPNERFEQQYVANNNPSEPDTIITKNVQEGPREVGLSPTTILVIVILAILAIGTVYFVVDNKNQNEEANRQAALESTRMQSEAQAAQARAQQSAAAAQQPPLVIQQPSQAPPVIIQQPAMSSTESKNAMDDSTMQELATKRLSDEGNLSNVTVTILDGKANLTGTVDSSDLKTKAERVVKAVRGVKSVDNKITVAES